jgi:hypothetical protein
MQAAWRLTIFTWLWRVALLLLPWQIRWFVGVELAGWPWEQGALSVYASLIPLIGTVLWAHFVCEPKQDFLNARHLKIEWMFFSFLFFVSLFVSRWNVLALRAICFWWFSFFVFYFFGRSLVLMKVEKKEVMWMFFWSLIPHAFLGLWQYADQFIHGSKWLGMASQDPRSLGVSVVEHGEYRLLRSYGGFSHPNIFGGWLAIGLLIAFVLSHVVQKKSHVIVLALGSALMMMALVLSYSRSAWIAFVVGLLFLIGMLVWQKRITSQFFWVVLCSIFIAGSIVTFSQWPHITSRFQAETRLERKSVSERVTNLNDAWQLFMRQPWFGYGPNAEMLGLSGLEKTEAPLQPPHTIFVLVVLDFGLIGLTCLLWLIFRVRSVFQDRSVLFLFIVCGVLGLFDHYLWSHWAGRSLFMMVCLFCVLPQIQMPEED